MSVAANFRITLSPRSLGHRQMRGSRLVDAGAAVDTPVDQPTGTAPLRGGGEVLLRRTARRPVRRVAAGRVAHPAHPVAAPHRVVARPCVTRPAAGSAGWLILVGVLTALVVLATGWVLAGPDAPPMPDNTVVVQLHPGETLWTVAKRLSPDIDSDAVVDRIRELNDLSGDAVHPGELLQVPTDLSGRAATAAGAIQP